MSANVSIHSLTYANDPPRYLRGAHCKSSLPYLDESGGAFRAIARTAVFVPIECTTALDGRLEAPSLDVIQANLQDEADWVVLTDSKGLSRVTS